MTLKTVLPELGKEGRFQEWYRLACNEATWEESFNTYLTKMWKHIEETEGTEETDAETNEPWRQKMVTTQARELAEPYGRFGKLNS